MATRRLVLVRHAKAANDSDLDKERSLADRGRSEAPMIGRWLAEHELEPDRIVVSPARRAQQTWELAAVALDRTTDPEFDERMYANTVDDLLAVIHDAAEDVGTLALVGHNPSIQNLAFDLDDGGGDASARDALRTYPTSGIAVFAVEVHWSGVDHATATLQSFAAPRG